MFFLVNLVLFVFLCIHDASASIHDDQFDYTAEKITKAQVLQQIKKVDDAFKSLFTAITRASKRVDYEKFIGNRDDPASLLPASCYSRFKCFYRVLETYSDCPKLHLSPYIWENIQKTLGGSGEPADSPTLYNTVMKLANCITNEFALKGEIEVLIKPQAPNINTTLPGLIDKLYCDIFQEWTDILTYDEDATCELGYIDDEANIFTLLSVLKTTADGMDLTPDHRVLITDIGNIDNSDVNTLFGKAVLTQKIVYATMKDYIPVNFAILHNVLTNKTSSISAAIKQTIRYLIGETTEIPQFSIMDRFDELQRIFKIALVERFFDCKDYWPGNKSNYNAKWVIEQTAGKQADIASSCRRDITPLNNLYARTVDVFCWDGSLIAQLVILSNILFNPSFIIDDVEFSRWNKLIGSVKDTNKNTILGILNFCYKNLQNFKTADVFEENLGVLVGGDVTSQNNNAAESESNEHSLSALMNSLFRMCFLPFFHEIQLIQDDIERLSARPDIDANTRLFVGTLDDSQDSFCGRFMYLKKAFATIYETNQFQWADTIFDKLCKYLPILHQEVLASIDLPTDQFSHTFRQAWWSGAGAYGTLNDIIDAVIGGGIDNVYQGSNTYYSISKLRPFNVCFLMESINTIVKDKKLSELGSIIGATTNGLPENITTINEKILYVQELLHDITKFAGLPEAAQVYSLLTAQKSGLIWKLKNIRDLLGSKKTKEAMDILGAPTSATFFPPTKSGTVLETLDALLASTFSPFFSFILDKNKANTIGLHSKNMHSLLGDLHYLQEYLADTGECDFSDVLGNDWDSKYTLTLSGKIVACEDLLLDFCKNYTYIPAAKILRFCGAFCEIVHSIVGDDVQTKIGEPLADAKEASLFGIINNLLTTLMPKLEPSAQKVTETIDAIAGKIAASNIIAPENKQIILQSIGTLSEEYCNFDSEYPPLITLWQIIEITVRRAVAGSQPRQAEQLLRVINKTQEKLDEIMQYIDEVSALDFTGPNSDAIITEYILSKIGPSEDFREGEEGTIFSITNDLVLRLSSMCMRLENLNVPDSAPISDFSNAFTSDHILDALLAIKQRIMPGSCPLFYLTHCLQMIYHNLLSIVDHCKIIVEGPFGNNVERMEKAAFDVFLEEKHTFLREIPIFLREIAVTLQYIAEVFPYTLHVDKLQPCIDISCDLADIAAATKGLQQNISALVGVLGYGDAVAPPEYESINSADNCDIMHEYFWKIGECLLDLSSSLRSLQFDVPQGAYLFPDLLAMGEYAKLSALEVDNIKKVTIPILSGISMQARNKRKLYCADCNIDKVQGGLEFLTASLLDVACALSYCGNLCTTFTDIAPFSDTYNILRKIYCAEDEKDIVDTLIILDDDIARAEDSVRWIMDKTIKMPNALNIFQKKDADIVTKFMLSLGNTGG